jgi:hypothetical protein
MAEVILNQPRVGALIGERLPAGVAQHMRMSENREATGNAVLFQKQIHSRSVQGFALLADEKRLSVRLQAAPFLEPDADRPLFIATERMGGRQSAFQSRNVQHAAILLRVTVRPPKAAVTERPDWPQTTRKKAHATTLEHDLEHALCSATSNEIRHMRLACRMPVHIG